MGLHTWVCTYTHTHTHATTHMNTHVHIYIYIHQDNHSSLVHSVSAETSWRYYLKPSEMSLLSMGTWDLCVISYGLHMKTF